MTGNTRTRSDAKREAIIQAATQAFQEYGVNGTSMDKLAELANVSKRTVYNHFATKEDLVMHLVICCTKFTLWLVKDLICLLEI